MTLFVDLQRRFRDLTPADLEEPEVLAYLNEHNWGPGIGWSELLENSRVVILAEAGAGKTREMIEQAKRLINEGRYAFFVALESLDREPLTNLLSPSEEASFEQWTADGQALAWFFLDAVDELKLTEGKLDRALLRMSKALNNCLDRARIIISCRPNDWRPSLDLVTIQERLPVPLADGKATSTSTDEFFLEALQPDSADVAQKSKKEQNGVTTGSVRTVILLPMSDRQIKLYAEQSGVHDADSFLAEVGRQNAWIFARRPLDLAELIATWISSGRLGTRTEQHEANVTVKLKDAPDRPDRKVLPESLARVGAERLALALALTRTRTLRSPDQTLDVQRADGVLDPSSILKDWTEEQRQALLRRALFDPATYGRVRFHHRSVQEYLAARRLKILRDKGMSTKALFRLLFAERYGVEVVLPSMRAIAAWLSLWDEAVREELTKREPEALLSLGDPETLSLSARAYLLKAFVESYGVGSWRGVDIPIDEIRRLAHPELAPVIRELWGDGPENADVRELLIELIWQGRIDSCADLAHAAALDASWNDYHRIVAIKALIECGKKEIARRLADDILGRSTTWSNKIVHGVAPDFFPEIIGVDEIITLMERTPEPKDALSGFSWASRGIAKEIDPATESAIALRDRIADLIWRGRNSAQEFYRIRGQFDYLAPALAILCERQIAAGADVLNPALIRACVIASRFGKDESSLREPIDQLREHFKEGASVRSVAFWAEVALMDELVPEKEDWMRFYNAQHGSLIGSLTAADQPWLEAALADKSQPAHRAIALHALISAWHQRGRIGSELDQLRVRIGGDTALATILEQGTTPPPRDESNEKRELKLRERQCEQAAHEAERLEKWKKWRDELLASPAGGFSTEKRADTIATLYKWLAASNRNRNRYDVWNKDALVQAFGTVITDLAEKAFREQWRTTTPKLWSTRPPKDRNSTPYTWIYGLCGVSAESSTPGWADTLSPEEARLAAAYATVELNGFSPFINDLAKAHPAPVNDVIGSELSAELSCGRDYSHLPILQDLTYAESSLKRLLSPRLLSALVSWPTTFTDETAPRLAHHLDQVLHALKNSIADLDCQTVAKECAVRYEADPTGPLALIWLKGLFRFDAQRGSDALIAQLTSVDDPSTRERAVATFASLFGDRDTILFEIADPAQRTCALGKLVRCAYAFVRHEDDHVHEGVYTPDPRDHAERARSFLLSTLLDTPGPDAQNEILKLATEPDFAHFPDRLRLLARRRAAADAEFAPYNANDILALENRYEVPPHDRDGLFTVMLDRLDDLSHHLAHHDFTDRRTLRSITDEAEMQRTLAWRLNTSANGAYVVTREDEVADQKRTDIRLSATKGDQKAVIEVKIADKRWSLSDFEHALRHQLVGQYLRHSTCKAGCLLLTYDGTKKHWTHPSTRKRMQFSEMVAYLNQTALELENEKRQEVRLTVFGLDLTDPPLVPAHR